MKNEIKIPSMGESISTVTIGQILIPSNTVVNADTEILELETDKVNQLVYSPSQGKLTLLVNTGDKATIGQVIGYIDQSELEKTPVNEVTVEPVQASAPTPAPEKMTAITVDEPNKVQSIRKGKEEFLAELNQPVLTATPKEEKISPTASQSQRTETRHPMSKIRKMIASRLVEVQHTTAMLTTFNEVDMSSVMQMREKYKDIFIKKYGTKLGFMSFFVKAATAALKVYPIFNSYLEGSDIIHREYYDLGIAVGTERGVIVPVVRNCDQLSFSGIELSIEKYAKNAKDGTLKVDDLQGAGFTITNGGVYGSLLSTPILAPMQCGILGMHKIEQRAVVVDNQIVIRPMMYLALSYDHRLADGKEAVSFLVYIKSLLEEPSRLLLEI